MLWRLGWEDTICICPWQVKFQVPSPFKNKDGCFLIPQRVDLPPKRHHRLIHWSNFSYWSCERPIKIGFPFIPPISVVSFISLCMWKIHLEVSKGPSFQAASCRTTSAKQPSRCLSPKAQLPMLFLRCLDSVQTSRENQPLCAWLWMSQRQGTSR